MTDLEFKTRMRAVLENVAVIAPNTVDDEVAAESVIDLAMDSMLRLIDVRDREQIEKTSWVRCSWNATSASQVELVGSAEPSQVRTGRIVRSGVDPKNDNELMDLKAAWNGVLKNEGVAEHLS